MASVGATVAGSGALEAAAQCTDAATVQYLLRHTPMPDQSAGLAESAARGDLELATLFLEHGAAPDRPDQGGMAPLHRAVISAMITTARAVPAFAHSWSTPAHADGCACTG